MDCIEQAAQAIGINLPHDIACFTDQPAIEGHQHQRAVCDMFFELGEDGRPLRQGEQSVFSLIRMAPVISPITNSDITKPSFCLATTVSQRAESGSAV